MGIEIMYKCDACGRICEQQYYRINISRVTDFSGSNMVENLICGYDGDDPIVCNECFAKLEQTLFMFFENLVWGETDDEI